MDNSHKLNNYCTLLESHRVTTRRQGYDNLQESLYQRSTIDFLNDKGFDMWGKILVSIQSAMAKDHAKIIDDCRKKGVSSVAVVQSADLFEHFLRVAAKSNTSGLNFRKIFTFIVDELRDSNKKHFHHTFLKIISHSFMTSSRIRSLLQGSDWDDLYLVLKGLKDCDKEELKCLALVVKWGPLYKLSVSLLREEFSFVRELCQELSPRTVKAQQESVLELLYDFCSHTAKDNRMECCKLGEEIFRKLIEIYEGNSNDDKIKLKIVDFFLLQVAIHNPGGVQVGSPSAYAVSWDVWQRCLTNIYDIITNEIDKSLESRIRNQSFFVVKKGINHVNETFSCLFVGVCRQLYVGDTEQEEPPTKRARIEFSVVHLIDKIRLTKSWTWVNLMSNLIETYPDVLTPTDYITLIKLLISQHTEITEPSFLHHTYRLLIILKKIEKTVTQVDLWRSLAESTLRLIGVNQTDEQIHMFLHQLLAEKYITNHVTLFQYFRPGSALNVTKSNIKTLDLAFRHFTFLQFDSCVKSDVIRWILTNGGKVFCDISVAEILICLILKQWVNFECCESHEKNQLYGDIQDVYLTISFEKLLNWKKHCQEETNSTVCADKRLLNTLIELMTNLDIGENTDRILNITILVFHVLSFLHKFDLIGSESQLCTFFEKCTKKLFEKIQMDIAKTDERSLEKMIGYVKKLNILFSTKISDFFVKKLRELVTEEAIRAMFQGLRAESEDMSSDGPFLTFKKCLIEALVSFSCLPGGNDLLLIQERALSVLVDTEYDCFTDSDYHLVLTLVKSIKLCQPKSLSENTLVSIFNLFQKFCEARYHCYLSTVKILNLFCEIYPFVAASDSDVCKSQFVEILYPFYCKRADYGVAVSNSLINCIGLLYELEPDCRFSRWSNEEIVLKIPEFLKSDFVEVRFNAIVNLVKFFKLSSQMRSLEQFHRQEIIFSLISEMSLKVFEIEGNVSEERLIDETVTRSSSILHTYASIMLASDLWIEEALFTLLRIACDKKLDLSQVLRIIEMVSKKLGFNSHKSFLKKHLIGLVNSWKVYDLEQFPFCLYNCDSKIEFYTKYWSLLASHIIENDKGYLNQVAIKSGKSLSKLIENTGPSLLSHCLAQEVSDLSNLPQNKIYKLVSDTFEISQLRQIFKNNIEEVILCLSKFIFDENHFKTTFCQNVIFQKTNTNRLTVDEFQECLNFIENTLYDDTSLVGDLMSENPEKIHFILLQLNLRINLALAVEEKLRYFHVYSIVAMLCVEVVIGEPPMQFYLLRNLIHTLLHNIKNYKNQLELSQISCKFFKKILKKTLPVLSNVVSEFFAVIVSRLKNIAMEDCPIRDLCIDMLQVLIVEHKDLFLTEIQKLDSIPNIPKFEKIFTVHVAIKYDKNVTLEDEIRQFLSFVKNIESFDECQHSLTHLRKLLTEKKDELKQLYLELRQTRGFSEDCENSILHKLISILITFSCSTNQKVSTEAMRCLGEIGPADLATLILEPEKAISDPKLTPWELLLKLSLTLMSKYIIDADVNVIKVGSVALFKIFSTKESRKFETENYLTPFYSVNVSQSNFNMRIDGDTFINVMKDDDLWIPVECCHNKWITRLVSTFLGTFHEREFFNSFIDVCEIKTEFCEQILPIVIYTVLYWNIGSLTSLVLSKIESFFDKHWKITINNEKSQSVAVNKSSVQTMLNVVHFVRLQQSVSKKQLNLNLNYLKVAKAAHFCTAHFTALLYAELWCQEQIAQSPNDYAISTYSDTKLDLIYEKVDDITACALQNILRQAYKAVGEIDALQGCGTFHLLDPSTRIEHYKELGRWDQVTHHYDLEAESRGDVRSLVESLKSAKLYQVSLFCSNTFREPNYECMWRLGQWGYAESGDSSGDTYDKCKFYAIKALGEDDEFSFVKNLTKGRSCVVEEFLRANMESIKNFYNTFAKLQALNEIEDFTEAVNEEKIAELLDKWKLQDEIIANDYNYIEPIHAQRIVLLSDFLRVTRNEKLTKDIIDTIIDHARVARLEGNLHETSRILKKLRSLPPSNDIRAKIQFEEAQLCWSIKDDVTAKCILRQFCTNENVNPRLHAMALKMTGKWMVESSSENRQTIIQKYFQKSLTLSKTIMEKSLEDEKSILDTFDQLAKFADQGYQEVMSHIKSDIFQKKKENIIKAKKSISKINLKKATKDQRKAVGIKQKQSNIDEIEISNIETEKNNLLQLALRYYLLNLIGSDDHNMTIFRLISLLVENRSDEKIRTLIEKDLLKIPTYKFITLLPQIVPHIGGANGDVFSQTMNKVIEKCAKDHPYHTLPLILALALSNKDRDYAESKAIVNDSRMQNAKVLLSQLSRDPNLTNLIKKMEFLSEAVIELAYLKNDNSDDGTFRVPKRCKILKIEDYDNVLLPTYTLPVSKSGDYKGIVGISRFGNSYQNVGGINAPKRISCRGTDGINRSQLIKGQDDLRQDAVMQQVFTIMNSLLTVNKQTKNLLIRTYKIVPLSMRSGILEWVENTMPIGEYLTGDNGDSGAHVKYRPMDKTPRKCRIEFKNSANLSNEERLRNFNKICQNIKPVFHNFFETAFPQPTVWYERRRAYIHSVATSSMCGYILGIGDRHVNNILIDKSTAEVVHIDFGIAFEQGRVLPTPETVPFRLTRDMVDGMGVSGIEGVFRRSCEKTVEVLRLHYQTIITILEVLLYDPLYDWTVSTAEANKRQKDEQDETDLNVSMGMGSEEMTKDVNVTAERALLRLRDKLQGTENGKLMTVEHQVGTLIQQAMDPSNLSRLFHGWQPYL